MIIYPTGATGYSDPLQGVETHPVYWIAAVRHNTAKVGITQAQADAIESNTAQVGGAVEQIAIVNNRYSGITNGQGVAIAANTAKARM